MSETLRIALNRAIEDGATFRAIERETRILRQSLMKFAKGETSLRLDIADRLAAYFELELNHRKRHKG